MKEYCKIALGLFSALFITLVLGYLSWRFLQVFIAEFDQDSVAIYRLMRYLLGVLIELFLVWGIAHLNFRLVFLKFFSHNASSIRGLYWVWIALLALLWFALLEWRTFYEPNYADENVLLTFLLTAFVIGYAYSADYFRTRRLQLTLLKEKKEAELNVLKAQIKPHFLFNTLNIIYNSAQKHDDEETAQLILELSQLLRFSIQEATQAYTSLQSEVSFLERYIHFQRLRLPQKSNVDIQIKLEGAFNEGQIAPLLLIPFVENAFQYGVSMNEPCFIHVDLMVQNKLLSLHVRNSISPNASAKSGLGTGIHNTRERLALLYPQRHSLHIQADEKVFQVELTLDLSPENPTP
ncbi:sensor histidine kinase [Haliscomenobacter hydrossis]|uniref:Signal transduction histidine kinase n=1 Tax=Haliscomenobacter hydrossis (strain ATCC 27775 / DSM 1100 / LMG 10767 / O) TaxID=760192 RepID=F4KSS6_HALH1|nr:histidine kinase [Haliscomenobacter hydrossis]AEE48040.1 putative signal transduction histidine kinase [Haliscomenobacter hydrossis DSM 1100]